MDEIKEKFLEYLENFEVFASEQVPEVFDQILNYGLCVNVFYVIFFAFILVIPIKMINKLNKKSEEGSIDEDGYSFLTMMCYVAIVICFIIIFLSCKNLFKIIIAPKLYLIDYFLGK